MKHKWIPDTDSVPDVEYLDSGALGATSHHICERCGLRRTQQMRSVDGRNETVTHYTSRQLDRDVCDPEADADGFVYRTIEHQKMPACK